MKRHDRDVVALQRRGHRCHVASLDESSIGNEQRALKMKAFGELTYPLDSPAPEDDTRPWLKVEGNHLQ